MDEDARYHRSTVLILGVCGLAMGVAYYLVTTALEDAMLAQETLRSIRGAEGLLTLYLLVSVVFGWTTAWLAERRGLIAWQVVAMVAAVALGSGFLLSVMAVDPLPGMADTCFLLSALIFVGTGLWRQMMET